MTKKHISKKSSDKIKVQMIVEGLKRGLMDLEHDTKLKVKVNFSQGLCYLFHGKTLCAIMSIKAFDLFRRSKKDG